MEHIICHDCSKQLNKGEEYVPYRVANEGYFKCRSCYEKDPVLKNFQPVECYSRIVGYIRPVKQWNPGKTSEWKQRKTFKIHI